MKKQITLALSNASKKIIISFLYLSVMIILFLGIFFSLFSVVNGISLTVLKVQIPGVIFGVLVLYLGLKYYFSVIKLQEELYKSTSKFSWDNFKSKKVKQ
ncbi:hypothetical protein [Clostridium paridis]|uniref:Uncharacterized protein n=1 Tax=Clostridium paridis TaxID=2803863 RepID=A0A937FI66_9CLOT|nr:hypothetical protein [Clostridium paridis]MBL4931881.1 hypothetical protein [Clostridium paridis]